MLRDVASEALSLIREIASPNKFSGDLTASKNEAVQDSAICLENDLSADALDEDTAKLVSSGASDLKLDVLKCFQPQVSISFHMIDLSYGFSTHIEQLLLNFFRILLKKV